MIGMVTGGMSYYHAISYCLEDKKDLTEEQKIFLSLRDGVQHKDRAEVLEYNYCFGDKYVLAEQYKDVRKLNKRVEKPVIHLAIRLAPGDQLTRDQWIEIGRAAAREFGIDKNQYICVLHKDTREPHIHIVGNRIGFDGKVARDSQNYRRMAALCRRLEKKYSLQQVLSPRRFLSPKERQLPRHDTRKERMKEAIRQALRGSSNYAEFEKKMQEMGFRVIKGRGILFEDEKKMRVKGSELGFSLQTIQKILNRQQFTIQVLSAKKTAQVQPGPQPEKYTRARKIILAGHPHNQPDFPSQQVTPGLSNLMDLLLQPVPDQGGMGMSDFEREEKRKRKKKEKEKGKRW